MSEDRATPMHPGTFIKENILPEGLTVKKAAEMMGVGRPALSNFLNAKASLSQNMATRLAKAFGTDKAELLKLQQEYNASQDKENERRIAVRSYTPSFLNIRATHIDTWAEKIETRSLLPALLRHLVRSTGSEISHCDFPAYDNSQRRGWDGQVDSKNTTPWVPSGISGWEFGCDKNPSKKANDDYSNRTKSINKIERDKTTFIFVTPHKWKQKDDWIKSTKKKNQWKDVRAYDANDLEQWLELSIPGQVFLAEKVGIPQEGCQTLGDYWEFWSGTSSPAINRKIFDSAVALHGEAIKRWYQCSAGKPLVITAGSKEEALAFLACASSSVEELRPLAEQAVLVSNVDTQKRLAEISTEFIPIAHTKSTEIELIRSFKNRLSIVIAEKNLKGMEADISVDLPDYESFRVALTEMGFDNAQIETHSNKSGKSPTILRRQLATLPALKNPGWATSNDRIRLMVPLVLAGTWKSNQDGDKEILRSLADTNYPDIEKSVADLASLDDAPIWSEGKYRGVVSKLDCFHAISDQITEDDLDKFFFVAEFVLSEDDPALDLDKDQRWAANIYEKVRDHSGAIRESICENLIILSIYGNGLFGKRLGLHIEGQVAMLVRKILKDQSGRVWQSQQGDLPSYAEASPEEFLGIVEYELSQESPAFASLFEFVDGGMFSRCERTGMLWALELLAWEPSRLARVAKVLAQLCVYKLEDNWVNKPNRSLSDILLSWMPHTAASLGQRCDVLELLCKEYPDVGWKICMREIKPGSSSTSGTYTPRWRSDASGAGKTVTRKDVSEFQKKCLELVLSWPAHTLSTLSDLIDCLAVMEKQDQEKVTMQITAWLASTPPDEDILMLRERVRTRTMTRGARKRNKDNPSDYASGKKIYALLEPQDILLKHQWLFAKQWVEYSPEELEVDDLDYQLRDEWLSKQRITSLIEILDSYGMDGLINLCLSGDAGSIIGMHLGRDIMDTEELQAITIKCLSTQSLEKSQRIDSCISGLLHQFDADSGSLFLSKMTELVEKNDSYFEKLIRLFINAPFRKTTWDLLCMQDKEVKKKYWENVYPQWSDHSSEDFNYLVDQLVEANRPRAAFHCAHLSPDRIESVRLIKLLTEVATNMSEPKDHYQFHTYEIEKSLESLNQRDDIARMELVRLEYLYIEALTPTSKYGIPNLSRDIADSPLLFMQMLALCFKRDDNGEDPADWGLPTELEQRKNAASSAFNVLEYINIIPGSQKDGTIDVEQLRYWIVKVRDLAKANGRADIADQRIGQILSKSGTGKDGVWPREEVRDVFEELASNEISIGMSVGIRNSRGAQFRPDTGAPERTLADKYRGFAESVMTKMPFTGRMLMNIAKSYEHDADWYDADGRVQKRLR